MPSAKKQQKKKWTSFAAFEKKVKKDREVIASACEVRERQQKHVQKLSRELELTIREFMVDSELLSCLRFSLRSSNVPEIGAEMIAHKDSQKSHAEKSAYTKIVKLLNLLPHEFNNPRLKLEGPFEHRVELLTSNNGYIELNVMSVEPDLDVVRKKYDLKLDTDGVDHTIKKWETNLEQLKRFREELRG